MAGVRGLACLGSAGGGRKSGEDPLFLGSIRTWSPPRTQQALILTEQAIRGKENLWKSIDLS